CKGASLQEFWYALQAGSCKDSASFLPFEVRWCREGRLVRPAGEASVMSAHDCNTQSAPDCRRTAGPTVVVNAMTVAPAAFPERTPAGTSSSTTQSQGENPSLDAPFK